MRLFNTRTQTVEPVLAPDGQIGIYVCGVTPYDTTHMGHAFTFLTYDILVRVLRDLGHQVTYVQNVTDIDDDILRKSGELGMAWDALAQRETAKFRADMRNLNAVEFDHYVAATDNIPEMQDIIVRLLEKDLAYVANGSVYFSVEKDPGFGKLSHLAPDEWLEIANERGNRPDDPNKRAPIDFIMWQAASPGEPTWDSPWGPGRPGWHIECSAMSMKYLGPTIDIHGGGYDLVFPHHECEIAQSENATGVEPFVRTWMHVAMVEYQGEKMSKSLGNLVLASVLLDDYTADAIRLYLFSHHYRTAWEFIDEEMEIWATVARDLVEASEFPAFGIEDELDVSRQRDRFLESLQDDLDTPVAIEELREIARLILEAPEEDDIREAQATLRRLGSLLGLTFDA